MEEKLVFDKKTKILKSNRDFEKYRDLYDRIKDALSYAEEKPDDLEGLEIFLFRAFNCYDVPWDLRIQYTKRNEECWQDRFVMINSNIVQKNVSLQKSGQILIEKLRNHIDDCMERHVSFHKDDFDRACHLLIILEKLLPVLNDRVARVRNIMDEIRDAALNDLSAEKNSGHYKNEFLRMKIAEYYYLSKDYTEALKQYTALVEQASQKLVLRSQDFILRIGECQMGLGRVDEAMQTYQQAIDSCLTEGYLRIGDYYLSIGNKKEAELLKQKWEECRKL